MLKLNKIKEFTPFCLSCLGRAFGKVGFGLDNRERGLEIITQLEINENCELEEKLLSTESDCTICDGLISEILNFSDLIIESLSDFSISTFKVGTKIDRDILDRELKFQLLFGENFGESLKSQLNREIGISVYKKSGLEAQMDNPDAVAIIDTSYDVVNLEIKSLFIEGDYNKYDRTLPQTRWPCHSCKGIGCDKCNNTGQLYPDSVQSLIASPFMIASSCSEDLFHG
jgi:tRNA pseudouridine synthase 10